MALIRWQPRELFDLRREVDRLFESVWGGNGENAEYARPAVWRPSVDIAETESDFIVTVDLPGISREDLDVTVVNNRLTIKGERRKDSESKERNVHRVERTYGTFTRDFDLPTAVNAEKITASYKDGVLTVMVPKAEEAKPKQIEVKVST